MESTPILVESTVNAPSETVWQALTHKEQMKEWYFDLAEFRPEVGFEFQFSGGPEDRSYLHLCQITEVEQGRKIAYSWRYDGYPGNTLVTFELFPQGDKTQVRLTHTGLETFPVSNPDFARTNFEAGWNEIIGQLLPAYLEKKTA
ncbi:SRPBCC family protein [Rufibacter aurantiacus]|uniref:SRPBCC family protein n=1 Tax=Rufibacter aurantiacus TaxID=2817374 RepID=UPI001B310179|nr:SRPBCC domain-containing protein [Rufibacter aurantiacus]